MRGVKINDVHVVFVDSRQPMAAHIFANTKPLPGDDAMRYISKPKRLRMLPFVASSLLCVGLATSSTAQVPANSFYVSIAGSDSNGGTTAAAPVRSLAKALTLASASGGGTVRMTAGHFDEATIALPGNVIVEGNWDNTFTTQAAFTTRELQELKVDQDPCAARTCITAHTFDRVITINKANSGLAQLVVLGPDRSAEAGGGSSYGIVVDGVSAALSNVVVKAGAGAKGATGDSGQPGQGYCSNGGGGGWGDSLDGGMFGDWCTQNSGAQGTSVSLYGRVANGGGGGGSGNSNCSAWPSVSNAVNGGAGGAGDPGIEGPPSAATNTEAGAFAWVDGALQWAPVESTARGNPGSAGAGGGGGGPGGSWNEVGGCMVGYPVLGGRGATGNSGGCGGGGGGIGRSGGGAFALVVNNGKVAAKDLVLFGGQGGAGGTGGGGNVGGAGEIDDSAGAAGQSRGMCYGYTATGATGGSGGHGGKGGGGGGGAGGNGGPAYTVVLIGTGDVALAGGAFRVDGGKQGSGGGGGPGFDSKTLAPTGSDGMHSDRITLPSK